MKTRTLLSCGVSVLLTACSGDTLTTPTPTAAEGTRSVEAYSVQVFVSQGMIANRAGIQSPARVDIAFRSAKGDLLDIVTATAVLKDDTGTELARQTFGASTGILAFQPRWENDVVGRSIDITLEARVAGTTSNVQFNLRL